MIISEHRNKYLYYFCLILCFFAAFIMAFLVPAQEAQATAEGLDNPFIWLAALLTCLGVGFQNNVAGQLENVWAHLSPAVQDWFYAVSENVEMGLHAVPKWICTAVAETWNAVNSWSEGGSVNIINVFPYYNSADISLLDAFNQTELLAENIKYVGSTVGMETIDAGYWTDTAVNNLFPSYDWFRMVESFKVQNFNFDLYIAGKGSYWQYFIWSELLGRSLLLGQAVNSSKLITVSSPFLYVNSSGTVMLYFCNRYDGGTVNFSYYRLTAAEMQIVSYTLAGETYSGDIDVDYPAWGGAAVDYNGEDVYLPVNIPAELNDVIGMPQTVAQGADVIADLGDSYAETMDTVISDQLEGIAQNVGDTTMNVSGIRGLLASLLATITNFFSNIFDVSQFQLDLDGFKNIILVDRFPFCIPFDFIECISVFASNASNYSFHIDVETAYWDIDHTVDMSPYAFYFGFFRYAASLWFSVMLISKTKDMIKW